jgi:hypothetical protein
LPPLRCRMVGGRTRNRSTKFMFTGLDTKNIGQIAVTNGSKIWSNSSDKRVKNRHAKLSLLVPDVLSKKFSSNLSAHLPPHILPKVRRAFVAHRVQRVHEVHESYFLRITSHCSLRSSRSLLHASSAMHLMPWHSLMQRRIPLLSVFVT